MFAECFFEEHSRNGCFQPVNCYVVIIELLYQKNVQQVLGSLITFLHLQESKWLHCDFQLGK